MAARWWSMKLKYSNPNTVTNSTNVYEDKSSGSSLSDPDSNGESSSGSGEDKWKENKLHVIQIT